MKCLRCKDGCEPYGQIASDNGGSFICVGENDGSDRKFEQDKYTLCWKNSNIDERSNWDKRDLTDTAAVILQALSVIENTESYKHEMDNRLD